MTSAIHTLQINSLLFCVVLLVVCKSTNGQDFDSTLERTAEKWNNEHVMDESSVTDLANFAYDWKELVESEAAASSDVIEEFDFQVFADVSPFLIGERLNELTANSDAIAWFENPRVQQEFNEVYDRAVQIRSPIGSMSVDEVLEYWLASIIVVMDWTAVSGSEPWQHLCIYPITCATPPIVQPESLQEMLVPERQSDD